jgi:hypothetical protein
MVNKAIEGGVPGLHPIGTRAVEHAAARRTSSIADFSRITAEVAREEAGRASNSADTPHFESGQPTPMTSPTITAASTTTSSPTKATRWKRKRSPTEVKEGSEDDDDDCSGDSAYKPAGASLKRRKTMTPRRTAQSAAIKTEKTSSPIDGRPVYQPMFYSFYDEADLLAVDERHSLEGGEDSDKDAEGEMDTEY